MSKLQEQRIKKGITQQELSNKTGISKRTIEAYEGKYHNLSGAKLKTLLKFCWQSFYNSVASYSKEIFPV